MRAEPRWSWTNESGEHCLRVPQPVTVARASESQVLLSVPGRQAGYNTRDLQENFPSTLITAMSFS